MKLKKLLFKISLICSIVISSFCFGQNIDRNGCLTKEQNEYTCNQINEQILLNLPDSNYNLNRPTYISVKHSLKKKRQRRKARQITALVDSVLNDSLFWKALRFYEGYKFAKWSDSLHQKWKDVSGKEIVFAMINGNPYSTIVPDSITFNAELRLYGPPIKTPFERAIGKDGGNGKIDNKRWFFRTGSVTTIGSNWVHELSHSRGFRHCFNCDENRDYSIPYVINRIFREVSKKYITSVMTIK